MKISTKLGLVAVSLVLIASVLVTAVNAQPANGPYSFHWWYKFQHQPNKVFDTDDDKDNKKHHNKHISKFDNGKVKKEERLDKKYCAGSGFWDGHRCAIDDPVEKAAYEDAVCDDPKDTDKYSDVCGGNSYAVEEKPKQKSKDVSVVNVKPFDIQYPQDPSNPSYRQFGDLKEVDGQKHSDDELYQKFREVEEENKKFDAPWEPQESADNSNTITFDFSDDKQSDNNNNGNDDDKDYSSSKSNDDDDGDDDSKDKDEDKGSDDDGGDDSDNDGGSSSGGDEDN